MRELKFRAWDKKEKRMIDFCDDGIDSYTLLINDDYWGITFDNSEDPPRYYPSDRFTLMQYTGLKDKNGKEIYEGDICIGLMDGGLDYTHIRFVVEFREGAFVDSYFHQKLLSEKQNLEVIGNIYEDPELLEEKSIK